jgi:hypothetical protein
MIYGQDRNQIRNLFRSAWQKYRDRQPLEALETMLAEVISMHPEYQAMLEAEHGDLDRDYHPEHGQSNPFLHMGMHISLREQYSTDRPAGIMQLYQKILIKMGDTHEAEHVMMECLGASLWQAQNTGQLPDENAYISCLKQIINKI